MLCLDMSKTFLLCIALAIVPPIVMVALHYDQWFAVRPIDPSLATGQVLFFEANWCSAGRSMQPVVAQLRGEGFDIRTLEVDTHQKQATDYDIHSIPAFVLMRDGSGLPLAALVLFRQNRSASFGGEQASSAEYILHLRAQKQGVAAQDNAGERAANLAG